VVESGDEATGNARLLVSATHAGVREEEVAATGELSARAHGQLDEIVDAARGDRVDVDVKLAGPADRARHGGSVLRVMGRVGDPEREPRRAAAVLHESWFMVANALSGASG
jgi:hypothetical protein